MTGRLAAAAVGTFLVALGLTMLALSILEAVLS